MKVKYTLLHNDKNTKARYGTLETNYGKFEMPMFMPVGTQATVKTLDYRDLKEINSGIILANTYHLWIRPGEDIVDKAGGLHKFMNYNGPILTDSGGFQVFSLAKPKNIKEEGVTFKNHLSGERFAFAKIKIREIKGIFGGELAGHYYFQDFGNCDSGVLASLLVLHVVEDLKKEGKKLLTMKDNHCLA